MQTAQTTAKECQTLRASLASTTLVAPAVVRLTLQSPAGSELPAWEPGAHIDLHLPGGHVRQYSLHGDPADRSRYVISVALASKSRGGSAAAHALRAGDQVTIGTPRNNFPLQPSPAYLFIAGGVGITPLLPMIAVAEARGANWALHYTGMGPQSLNFHSHKERFGNRIHLYTSGSGHRLNLKELLREVPPNTLVYCSGPASLVQAARQSSQHWPADTVRTESFAPVDVETTNETPFEIYLAKSGRRVTVQPGVSALSCLRAAGAKVVASCLDGVCGTCEQIVLDGEVDHRDSVLSPAEQASNESMLVCVSRAKSARLILDL